MAQRLRLYDVRVSRLPSTIGLCQSDTANIARYVNSAQSRLLLARESGEEGWWGTWAEMVFNVSRSSPYLTLPREVARIEAVNVCDQPVAVQNQFYEYLQFGNGRLPKSYRGDDTCFRQVYTRNNVPTFVDLDSTSGPQNVYIYATDPADMDGLHRVLIQGLDNNGNTIYSQDNLIQVTGVFNVLKSPFVAVPLQMTSITGVQKDVTAGPVQIFQVDPTTGAQTLLLTMQPTETTAWYRRYYFHALPCGCCPSTASNTTCPTAQVKALAKLELIPVKADTDYLLFQNLEAIIEECGAVRYSEMDTVTAKQLEGQKHANAIRLLNGELNHYLGDQSPAINFAPFGSARLNKRMIGSMI